MTRATVINRLKNAKRTEITKHLLVCGRFNSFIKNILYWTIQKGKFHLTILLRKLVFEYVHFICKVSIISFRNCIIFFYNSNTES